MPRAIPYYRRIMNDIRRKIGSGEWPPGHELPSTRELADQYGVSVGTVRAAVDRLVEAGVLEGHQGLAVFVAPRE
ncbi:MAG TPA: GntR family transcriptional regulator [Jiangellaceae bacterium]|nr:GntR family transcriptional regulator [Jiangellaceae bacterium]